MHECKEPLKKSCEFCSHRKECTRDVVKMLKKEKEVQSVEA